MKKTLQLDGASYGQAAPDGERLRGRRLEKLGKVELLQITSDPPSYWFAMLCNFDPKRDLAPGLIDPSKGNVWRSLGLERAKAKFGERSTIPRCARYEQKRQELRNSPCSVKTWLAGASRMVQVTLSCSNLTIQAGNKSSSASAMVPPL